MGFTLRQIQVFHQCRQAQIDIGVVVLLVRRQLLELVVVIQRGNFDAGLGQANAQQRAHGAVEHRHVKLQVIPHQRAATDKSEQLLHCHRQRQALGQILGAQPVDAHAVGRYRALGPHQQFQAFAGHDAVALDAHCANRDDFVGAHIQSGGFAIQRHPFVGRRGLQQRCKARVTQPMGQPPPPQGRPAREQRGAKPVSTTPHIHRAHHKAPR